MSRKVKKTRKPVRRIPEEDLDKTRKYKIKTKKHSKLRKTIKITLLVILLFIIIAAGIIIGKIFGILREAKLNMEEIAIKYENSIVKDINGETIAVLNGNENRETVPMSEMSQYLPKAFVAIEDERFYEHKGVDLKRTGAATVNYILHRGNSSFGGSTITQQLVKNLTEEDDRTWQRKVKEMARAYYLGQELSKSQVLELYLNLIFLGGKAYGVEVASNYYFSKSSSELTLAECAFLAGINNSPNLYRPFSEEQADKDRIYTRTKIVLDKMRELGPEHKAGITEEEYQTGIEQLNNGLVFQRGTITQTVFSYHTDAAINQVKRDLKEKNPDWTEEYIDRYVKSGGLTIYTTQNTEMQKIMEEEATKSKYVIYSKYNKDDNGDAVTAQLAMVLIDHRTGYVLATVGGIGEKTLAFGLNRATQSIRQPGSSMKPLAVLCPGIDAGVITAGTVYDDIPYSSGQLGGFKNYGRSYNGLTTIRYNIAASKNIPMLKAINDIGVEKSVEFLKSAGITSIKQEQENITLALGGADISPLEMAGAYAAIANDGVYIEPTFYTKVVDADGKTILEPNQETRTIMASSTAYIVKEILTEVVRSGTGGFAGLSGISVGVKTGTTNDDYDRWFCGFTPYYTASAWYGYDQKEQIVYNGTNPAGLFWDGVMEQVHKGLASAKFSDTRPSNITTATICKASGKLATDKCREDPRGNQVYTEYFVKGTVPSKYCDCHVKVKICTETGLLANEYCPSEEKVFITRPESETGNWKAAKDADYMLTIKDTCTKHKAPVVQPKPEKPAEEKPTNPENGNTNTVGGGNTTNNTTTNGNTTNTNTTSGNNTTNNNTTGGNTTNNNTTGGGNTTNTNTTSNTPPPPLP